MFAANVDDAMTSSRSTVGLIGLALRSLTSFFGRPAQNDSMLVKDYFSVPSIYTCVRMLESFSTVPISLIKRIFRWNPHSIHMSFENQNIGQEAVRSGSEKPSWDYRSVASRRVSPGCSLWFCQW